MIFFAGASALMVGNYLTTTGRLVAQDLQMLKDLGLDPRWQTNAATFWRMLRAWIRRESSEELSLFLLPSWADRSSLVVHAMARSERLSSISISATPACLLLLDPSFPPYQTPNDAGDVPHDQRPRQDAPDAEERDGTTDSEAHEDVQEDREDCADAESGFSDREDIDDVASDGAAMANVTVTVSSDVTGQFSKRDWID
jgi:hypothetical protein